MANYDIGDGVRCKCNPQCNLRGIVQYVDGHYVHVTALYGEGYWKRDSFMLKDCVPYMISDEELADYTRAVLVGEIN